MPGPGRYKPISDFGVYESKNKMTFIDAEKKKYPLKNLCSKHHYEIN